MTKINVNTCEIKFPITKYMIIANTLNMNVKIQAIGWAASLRSYFELEGG